MEALVERLNAIRVRLPFAYWIVYDLVVGPLLVYGALAVSRFYLFGIVMLVPSAFFDVIEAIWKWRKR